MSRILKENVSVNIMKALKEADENYVVVAYWGDKVGYVARDEETGQYDILADKSKAIRFNSEEEANNAIEDMNQFFGGRAKLTVEKA